MNKGSFWSPTESLIPSLLVALDLCCCLQAFPSCGEWGLLFGALLWLLIAVAPLAAGLSSCGAGLSSCGAQLCGMWELPRRGIEPASAGGLSHCTTRGVHRASLVTIPSTFTTTTVAQSRFVFLDLAWLMELITLLFFSPFIKMIYIWGKCGSSLLSLFVYFESRVILLQKHSQASFICNCIGRKRIMEILMKTPTHWE